MGEPAGLLRHRHDPAVNDLLVIVPTRGRPEQCGRLFASFCETRAVADLLFVTDPDEAALYCRQAWTDKAWLQAGDPRLPLSGKLNRAAAKYAGQYRALMFTGDDHVFRTPRWDEIMLDALAQMGGTGILYPDDRRRSDIPEIWMTSADIVRAVGWFACPYPVHFYLDNALADLGRGAGCLRWVPEAVVEHLHYTTTPGVPRDATYALSEHEGRNDQQAYEKWRAERMADDIAAVRALRERAGHTEGALRPTPVSAPRARPRRVPTSSRHPGS